MFRGREMAHTDLGRKILDRLVEDFGERIVVESMPKQEGRNMIMVIAPNKRYAEASGEGDSAAQDAEEDGPDGARARGRGSRGRAEPVERRTRRATRSSPRPVEAPVAEIEG